LPGGDHVAAFGCGAEKLDQAVEDLELGLHRVETLAELSGAGFALGDGLLRGLRPGSDFVFGLEWGWMSGAGVLSAVWR